MNQEEQYSFSPLDSYQWIKKEAFAYIKAQQWIDEALFEDFLNAFEDYFKHSLQKVSHLIENELDEGNVQFAVLVVALYEALFSFPAFIQKVKQKDLATMLGMTKYSISRLKSYK